MKNLFRSSVGVLTLVALSLPIAIATTSAVSAPKATGGVAMAGPLQYATFSAFPGPPVKGTVDYTNFEYPAPGTGVWNAQSSFTVHFSIAGDYYWNAVVDTRTALGTNSLSFTGTISSGIYSGDLAGMITGTSVVITVSNVSPGLETYTLLMTGTISGGSITGGAVTGGWWDPATPASWAVTGGFQEVLSFEAGVTCAVVSGNTATFGFSVPAGLLSANPYPVIVRVTDGATPATVAPYDTWAHAAGSSCTSPPPLNSYTITSGNITVH